MTVKYLFECRECFREYADFRRDQLTYRYFDIETGDDFEFKAPPHSDPELPKFMCKEHKAPYEKFQELFKRDRDKIIIFTDDRWRGSGE